MLRLLVVRHGRLADVGPATLAEPNTPALLGQPAQTITAASTSLTATCEASEARWPQHELCTRKGQLMLDTHLLRSQNADQRRDTRGLCER